MRKFNEVKEYISDKATAFNQLPNVTKAAAAGLVSAAIATANQPDGCNSTWTQHFAISMAVLVGAGAVVPTAYAEAKNRLFTQKKKVKFDDSALKEATSPKK